MRPRPEASVVVIAYNDARRLPRAVASVLAQSMGDVETVIVDDASTDGTGQVADRLAAAHPGRVRAIHLPANSGGCGRPRNIGIERSHGRYLMFLDSDDLLDRHACLNLVSAAADGKIMIWDPTNGQEVATLEALPGSIRHMTLSADGLRLAIGNARTTEADVRLAWEVLRQEAERC